MELDFGLGGLGDNDNKLQQILALGEAPAFLKRAIRVQEAWGQLLVRCRLKRMKLAKMVRLDLGRLFALAGDWKALSPWLSAGQIDALRNLYEELNPRMRVPVEKTTSQRVLRRAIVQLQSSMARFNERWNEFLNTIDLTAVNQLREKYNKYYVLEKEFVVRSPILAKRGFEPLHAATIEDVKKEFPMLPDLLVGEAQPIYNGGFEAK